MRILRFKVKIGWVLFVVKYMQHQFNWTDCYAFVDGAVTGRTHVEVLTELLTMLSLHDLVTCFANCSLVYILIVIKPW